MPYTTYAELKTAVARTMKRTDLTSYIPDYITLCEADLQVRCRLLEFEAESIVTIAAGEGDLPSDFLSMRAVFWSGNLQRPLRYMTPQKYAEAGNTTGLADFYTIAENKIKTAPVNSGSLHLMHSAKFTPLSDSNTSNSLLLNSPDVYLYGAATHGAIDLVDDAMRGRVEPYYEKAIQRIKVNNNNRKYGAGLEVRVS